MNQDLLASALSALELRSTDALACVDALHLQDTHCLPFRTDMPVLLVGIEGTDGLGSLQQLLLRAYPPDQVVQVLDNG
jgi:hypothetical protein